MHLHEYCECSYRYAVHMANYGDCKHGTVLVCDGIRSVHLSDLLSISYTINCMLRILAYSQFRSRDGGGCLYPVIQWKTAASVVQALKAAN